MELVINVAIIVAAVVVYVGLTWILSRNLADRIDARLNFKQWRPENDYRRAYEDKE
jgi:hypothetical protein